MAEEKKTVTVACSLANGLTIQLEKMVEGPLGIRTAQAVGAPVTLRQGDNPDVDAGFWAEWLSLHEKDPLVVQGILRAA